jgi:UDP-glucose 4-epimerase
VHVDDVIAAVMVGAEAVTEPFAAFNVATEDYMTVTEIAEMAVETVGLPAGQTKFEYTGGDRGWKGDVPIVRLNSGRIRSLGWKNERSCKEALRDSMAAMLVDARAGRFDE